MVIQLINLSIYDIFKNYSLKYKINRDVQSTGLFGLEMREVHLKLAEKVQKIVLKGKEICYKNLANKNGTIDLFIPGSLWQLKNLSRNILAEGDEDFGYKIINVIKNFDEYGSKTYKIGGKNFTFNFPYVMGILNITPDSFSDGGLYFNQDDAVKHALKMIEEGAAIIDIGGESTRPGAVKISSQQEIDRVIPVIKKILDEKPSTIISVDTTKNRVAEAALEVGANIINDISGLTFEPEIIDTVKSYGGSVAIMHIKGTPEDMQKNPYYEDVVLEIYDYLSKQTKSANKKGIENIFIDPGIGFGKTVEHNFEILRRLEDFKCLGYPIIIGLSRKSFIGKSLNLEVTERDNATSVVESIAINNGARIIRTHNVKYGVQVCKIMSLLNKSK